MNGSKMQQIEEKQLVEEVQQNKNCRKSMIADQQNLTDYKSTINEYQQFLKTFENRIQTIYSKQCYRIYLNEKTNEREYKGLMNQRDELVKALQESKDYRQSVNRGLIQQIMNLQKLKDEYEKRNEGYEQKIKSEKVSILTKKRQLKSLETQIKSYWIYNYDIKNPSISQDYSYFSGKETNINSILDSRVSKKLMKQRNDSEISSIHSKLQSKNQSSSTDKQNKNTQNSKNLKTQHLNTQSFHLPYIKKHYRYISTLKNTSSSRKFDESSCFLSKDLTLLNTSVTKQKILQKMEASHSQKAWQKVQYERQKLNLLKMFKSYLKKKAQSLQSFTQRVRLQKITKELSEKINVKDQKLIQIEKLLNS